MICNIINNMLILTNLRELIFVLFFMIQSDLMTLFISDSSISDSDFTTMYTTKKPIRIIAN